MESATTRRARTNPERVAESTLRLVEAAMELIAEKGFERTTAAEIGERAGYSRNMVRDRYGSKEALLEALLEREFAERLLPAFRRDRPGPGLERVLGQLDDLLVAAEESPEIMRAMIVLTFETSGPLEDIRAYFTGLISGYEAELAGHLEEGRRDGSVDPALDPARKAEEFVSYAIGLCFRWALWRDGYDFTAEVRAWRGRLERELAAPA